MNTMALAYPGPQEGMESWGRN